MNTLKTLKIGDKFFFINEQKEFTIYQIRDQKDPKIYLETYDNLQNEREEMVLYQSDIIQLLNENLIK